MSGKKGDVTFRFNSVVLIDDNEVDNMIHQKLLENSGFAKYVYTYTSGKSALEFFKNLDRNEDFPENLIPRVIFLDINMPIMSGFSFIEALQKLSPRVTKGIKIVLLTQSANPLDMQQAKKSKMVQDYLVKPLSAALIEAVNLG